MIPDNSDNQNGVEETDLPNAFNSIFSRSDFIDKFSKLKESHTSQNELVMSQEWVQFYLRGSKPERLQAPMPSVDARYVIV